MTEVETGVLREWVRRGGTLVYLASRNTKTRQTSLNDWLRVSPGPLLPSDSEGLPPKERDLTGTTVRVWVPVGAARGLERLRVIAGPGSERGRAGGGATRGSEGRGGDVAGARGPGRGLRARREWTWRRTGGWSCWTTCASGTRWRRAGPSPSTSTTMPWARSRSRPRRGPSGSSWRRASSWGCSTWCRGGRASARPARGRQEKHRSALEYVRSLGWLARRSKVERELVPELGRHCGGACTSGWASPHAARGRGGAAAGADMRAPGGGLPGREGGPGAYDGAARGAPLGLREAGAPVRAVRGRHHRPYTRLRHEAMKKKAGLARTRAERQTGAGE